tara:strand:+ start:14291 stop:15166 length:876 start_codon:yes stop_codon:yes gene_type:complete
MKAFIFPGQGSQFSGMGYDLYKSSQQAKDFFDLANKIIGFDICKIMFEGSDKELQQTKVTQPAIFIHSVILSCCIKDVPSVVAGHSLGEFSALVSADCISFEDGLRLVVERAEAMQIACTKSESTMAAVIGLNSKIIEEICAQQAGIVVPANYNSPNQIVISGERKAIEKTCQVLIDNGAKKTVILPVSGAFHSPIMESAKTKLKLAIENTYFKDAKYPVYQNVYAQPVSDKNNIKENLISQLTSPVKWYQTIENMINQGVSEFIEVGPKNVLTGLNRRINREVSSIKAEI